jgi:hypothetical protein
VLGVLCLLEVASIRKDRAIQDDKHVKELDVEAQRFDRLFSLFQGVQIGQNLQLSAERALSRESEHLQKTSEERQLKVRTLDLSRDIAEFTTRVRMEEVALPIPTTHGLARVSDPAWAQWQAQLENIEHNAIAQYHVKFGASVKDLIEQLQKRNGWDSKECNTSLDMAYKREATAQFLYVIGCAQDLQVAANKIP